MVEWAENFAAEMLRLMQGRAAYADMLDWAFELWPAGKPIGRRAESGARLHQTERTHVPRP